MLWCVGLIALLLFRVCVFCGRHVPIWVVKPNAAVVVRSIGSAPWKCKANTLSIIQNNGK